MSFARSVLYPLVTLFSIGGVTSFYYEIKTAYLVLGLILLLILYFLPLGRVSNQLKSGLLYFSFFVMGMLHFQEFYRLPDAHFQNQAELPTNGLKRIKIIKPLGTNFFSYTFLGELRQWEDVGVEGEILIYQTKDSLTIPFQRGQEILTKNSCRPIADNLNPGGFSYKNYLKNSRINHQIQVNEDNTVFYIKEPRPPFIDLLKLREKVEVKIETVSLSKESKGMLKALLLGERKAIEDEILTSYTQAGVIHLLALSGLHVGLLVLLLMYLLTPLTKVKFGKNLRLIMILLFLWCFALFVGLSASVVRSVTLFTFVVIGHYINQGKHSFHYTVLSFFILLVCHPPFLRNIGFQLSFLAVIGILWIHPLLQRLWNPSHIVLRRLWQLTTVSIAAQIAVSPVSIYYFHQFPSLFLLSNLIILPFFGFFLSLSLVVLLSIVLELTIPFLFPFYEKGVYTLNSIVFWVAQQEAFLFENIYNSLTSTLLLYGILICGVFFFIKRTFARGTWVLLFLFAFVSNLVIEAKKENAVNAFWIFHKHNESILGHQKGGVLYYHTSHEGNSTRLLLNFTNSRLIKEKRKLLLKNSYAQKGFRLLLLREVHVYGIKQIAPTHILLQKNIKLNLDLLLEDYKPKLIIADGSNAPWFTERWKKSCAKYKVPFHDTRKTGALKITLESEE